MFETLLNADIQAALLAVLTWVALAVTVARRPVPRSPRRIRARAVVVLVLTGLAFAALAFRIVTTVLMGRHGYIFAADRVAVALPALAVPAVATGVWSVPAVLRAARAPAADSRIVAFTPRVVVPPLVGAVGAVAGLWTTFFMVLAEPLARPAATFHAGLLTLAAVLWWAQRRRWAEAAGGGYRRRRPLIVVARAVSALVVVGALVSAGTVAAAAASRLPSDMAMAGPGHAHGGGHVPLTVPDLAGPRRETPDVRVTLTAAARTVRLTSGTPVGVWAFNDRIPGPAIHVRQGQLLEITVVNRLPGVNLAVHWHGMDVPNAEDGVPGVTQDAVRPGDQYVYRFRAEDVGTHWYHSHQQSSVQVAKGLFGALIVDPPEQRRADRDWFLAMHSWTTGDRTVPAFGLADTLDRRRAQPGDRVRLRVLNSDRMTHAFSLTGTSFAVTAVDGNPVNGPVGITGRRLQIGAGGRLDVEFVMPDRPVRLTEVNDFVGALDRGVLISRDGTGNVAPDQPELDFDPTRYGAPAATAFGSDSAYTRSYSMIFDNELGFYDGRFTFKWAMNGRVFPDGPHLVVRTGDLVKLTFANRSHFDHPMHLHGHKMLVLSRDGRAVTGSPIWLDTVNVRVGEVWEVAFRADNPGIWMDHCHISEHAAKGGMMTHLSYEGVSTPYRVGPETPNIVE